MCSDVGTKITLVPNAVLPGLEPVRDFQDSPKSTISQGETSTRTQLLPSVISGPEQVPRACSQQPADDWTRRHHTAECEEVLARTQKTHPVGGPNVIRRRPAAAREMFTVRLERELREAVDREAAKRRVTRSELVRDALVRAVDQDVLEEAAERERLEAFVRGWKADEERVRAALTNELHNGSASRPRWLTDLTTGTSSGVAQTLADQLRASLSQRRTASAG